MFSQAGDASGFFNTFFGGLFLVKGIPLASQLLFLFAVPTAVAGAAVETSSGDRRWGRASEVASIVLFTLACLLCLQPWDELFVNLRHAKHLAESGTFSFNRLERLEGIVDFLPYATLGLLAKLGLPLDELAFLQGYLGGLFCLVAVRQLAVAWGFGAYRSWVTLGAALFPPLAFNSSHGFATTVFTAAVLFAVRLLFFAPPSSRLAGWLVLSTLPLFRLEALWLLWLLAAWRLYVDRTGFRRYAVTAVGIQLPVAALSLWRQWYFGSAIPIPVRFKASAGSLFYSVVGVRNLAADLVASGILLALLFLAVALWLFRYRGERLPSSLRIALGPLTCLVLFVLPYYVSGGDWFPSYWARYCLPLALFVVPLGTLFLFPALPATQRMCGVLLAASLLVFQSLWPISSISKGIEAVFTHRRLLAKIFDKKTGRGHYRIQHLSQLGRHLSATTPKDAVIASSEVATIMYFADRGALDLLGVANRTIAEAPLRNTPPLWRPFPTESELPYLIFKRLQRGTVEEKRPPFLFTFDFMLRDLVEKPYEEITNEDLFAALRRWEYNLKGLLDPLYGGVAELQRLGYEPVIVRYRNAFCAMYFVSKEALADHVARLRKAGFVGGVVSGVH